MANQYRHHIEYDKPRHYAVGTALIEIGDLCWQEDVLRQAWPASSVPWQGTVGTTQQYFAKRFIGVANQTSLATEPAVRGEIYISTCGVFGFPVEADATAELGDMYTAAWDGATGLLDQVVELTASKHEAIATLAYRVPLADCERQIEIFSPVTDLSRKCCWTTSTTTSTTTTTTTTAAPTTTGA